MLIDAIRHAEERLIQRGKGVGRRCGIMMDLAGPKIRTGPMETEVRLIDIEKGRNLPCMFLLSPFMIILSNKFEAFQIVSFLYFSNLFLAIITFLKIPWPPKAWDL
jgi:hypothetical protein